MTEKRFTMSYECYHDNLTGKDYDEKWESYKICDLLNELAEENEQLKQQVEEMIELFEDSGLDYHISDELEEILND